MLRPYLQARNLCQQITLKNILVLNSSFYLQFTIYRFTFKIRTLNSSNLSNSSNSSNFKPFILQEDPVSTVSSSPPIAGDSIHPPWPDDPTTGYQVLSILYTLPDGCIQVVPTDYPGMNRTGPKFHHSIRPAIAGRSPRSARRTSFSFACAQPRTSPPKRPVSLWDRLATCGPAQREHPSIGLGGRVQMPPRRVTNPPQVENLPHKTVASRPAMPRLTPSPVTEFATRPRRRNIPVRQPSESRPRAPWESP